MAGRGYVSDSAVRKSSRKKARNSVMTFNFIEGESTVHPGGTQEEYVEAMQKGSVVVIAAEMLDQAHMTRAMELSGYTVVEFHADQVKMSKESIKSRISANSVEAALNPVKMFFREEISTANNKREEEGKQPSFTIRGLIHWTFSHQFPEVFNVVLAGKEFNWKGPIPKGLEAIGINTTSKHEISVDVDPNTIKFTEGEVHTPWRDPHMMKIVFLNLSIPAEQLNQVKFRFRVAAAAADPTEFRIRMEMLVLPQGMTIDALNPAAQNAINNPSFPAIPLALRTAPIKWENDAGKEMHKMFTAPLIFVKNPEDYFLT